MFYYFDFKEKDVMDKIIDNIDFNHIGNIPKQALIELIILCLMFAPPTLYPIKMKTLIFFKNIERAINHIKRGQLDCYKIIIKDYFILENSTLPIGLIGLKNQLFNLRINEYKI